ncbi:MAG TPA: SIMPL domain-containing protein, partial [Gemmatimonadaceae bacterium]|nr:SIMPL domain-containing protein [Gemmatimonadaceae bacterium]
MKIFILSALIALSAPLSAQEGTTIAPVASISVGARGEVKVSPDRAAIQISVQTRAVTAAAAASENARKQKAVIDALRALGLAASDISTINYNVYPEQRYEPNREPTVVGYNVTNTVLVELKTLTMVGPVIDAAL